MRNLGIALSLVLMLMPATVDAHEDGHEAVRDRIEEIVGENFYDAERGSNFSIPRVSDTADSSFDMTVSEALAGLGASHTGRHTSDRIDYYELIDIFRSAVSDELRRLFPPEGEVSYPGIGLIAREIDGTVFASHVYHAGSAARAGIREGDEILAVDGEPYHEIASFEGMAGETVTLQLRRQADAEPVGISVEVEEIRPNRMFTQSISESIRVIPRGGHSIGYMRIWSFTSAETRRLIHRELATGRLSEADALVLDLRSRWGGAPLDAAEIFVGGTPQTDIVDREGTRHPANPRWRRPVVAIIDEGTRSGLEVFAHALQVNDIPLVGTRTARAVLAGRAFLLPDDSLLIVAVSDVITDGMRLEETGVAPDIAVERDNRYENGADPQIEAAFRMIADRLQDVEGDAGAE
jgi:C-terminal processing protease CtpA/Prc